MAGELGRASSRWNDLFKARDFDAIGQLYTEDCKLYVPGYPPMEGRQAAARAAQGAHQAGGDHAAKETHELLESGDLLMERGGFTLYKADGTVLKEGKFVQICKKEGGEWKIYIDCPSSNADSK